jgi:putative transcription factor
MSECEICGAEIRGKVHYITIGNSKLSVCRACARYGTVIPGETEIKVESEHVMLTKAKKKLYEQMDHDIEDEIEENYGRKVKEAREKAGLKQAELAQKINEKQSLLRKIENEEIIPNEGVMRKIERVLNL